MCSLKRFAGSLGWFRFGSAGNGRLLARVRRAWVVVVVSSLCIAIPAGADIADNDPAEIVSYRQLLMRSLDLHMDGIAALIDGKIDYWEHLSIHAEAIERLSRGMIDVFPHWTGPKAGKTRALPAIWQHWQDFKSAAHELETGAAALVGTVGSIDRRAIQAQYSRLRRTCDGCHLRFAKPE